MIKLFKPAIPTEEVLAELRPVFESGWLGRGPKVEEFEAVMAARVGAKHFIATSSCTVALEMAVQCIDVPKGTKIITTPITFISTNAAILRAGFVPNFQDVDPITGSLNKIGTVTVHIGGKPAPFNGLMSPLVEDCAHALGSELKSSPRMRCWSFHAVKNLPMGDGGGISTNDGYLADRLRRLSWMGITKDTFSRSTGSYQWEYDVPELGFKGQMNDIQAAIGLVMLRHLDAHNARRKAIAKRYSNELHTLVADHEGSSCHFVPVFVNKRDELMQHLKEKGIESGMHYRMNTHYAPFSKCPTVGDLKGAKWYEAHEITLPIHPSLSDDEVTVVIEAVNNFLRETDGGHNRIEPRIGTEAI